VWVAQNSSPPTTVNARRTPLRWVRFATKIGSMYRPRNAVTGAISRRRVPCIATRAGRTGLRAADEVQADASGYVDGVVSGVAVKDKNDAVGRMFPQPELVCMRNGCCSMMRSGHGSRLLFMGHDPMTLEPRGARLVA